MINECFYEGSHDQWRKSKFQCINKIIVTNECMYECVNLNIVLTNLLLPFDSRQWVKRVKNENLSKYKYLCICLRYIQM